METKVPTIQSEQPVVPELELLNEVKPVKDASFNREDDLLWMKSEILKQLRTPSTASQYWVKWDNRSSGTGPGTTTFTPGFRPKLIRVTTTDYGDSLMSFGATTAVGSDYVVSTNTANSDRISYIYSGSTKSSSKVTSITDTEFTIEWYVHSVNIYYLIEVFG